MDLKYLSRAALPLETNRLVLHGQRSNNRRHLRRADCDELPAESYGSIAGRKQAENEGRSMRFFVTNGLKMMLDSRNSGGDADGK